MAATAAAPTIKKTSASKEVSSAQARALMSTFMLLTAALSIASLVTGAAYPAFSVSLGSLRADAAFLTVSGAGGLFLAATLYVMFFISRQMSAPPLTLPAIERATVLSEGAGGLNVNEILEQEFEYARETAAQAMDQRLTIVNFYLLVVGGAGSIIGALLATNSGSINAAKDPFFVATVALLWLVFLIGWLTHFKIVRLRSAWIESAMAMSYIKEFYIVNAKEMPSQALRSAFFYRPSGIPKPYKSWNVYHFSALLIALLDAGAYLGGFMLLGLFLHADGDIVIPGALLAILAFYAHVWIYDIALKPKPRSASQPAAAAAAVTSDALQWQQTSASGPDRQPNAVVDSRTVFRGKLITVRQDEIRLPDGQSGEREIVEHQPAVVIVAYLDESDSFLFVEQYRDAVHGFLLEVPAGLVDGSESPEQTARRELREETGYEIGDLVPLGSYYTSPGFTDELHHLFLARRLTRIGGIADPNEISAVRAISRDEVMGIIERGELHDGKSILGILWSLRHLPTSV
jgi:ADP-ribose pyrophosphatase